MKKRGIGLALAEYPTGASKGGDLSQAIVKVKPDGSVTVYFGTTDLGQGCQTVAAQIAAEELGIPVERVEVFNKDTDLAPYSSGAMASRACFADTNAIGKAARKAKKVLLEVAGSELGVSTDNLVAEEGVIYVKNSPEKSIPIDEVAWKASNIIGKMVIGSGSYLADPSEPDPETGACNPYRTIAWCALLAEVEVDTDTGEIDVLRLEAAYDVGRAINPGLVRGQIIGGSVMGVGSALMEHLYPYHPSLDWAQTSLGDYSIPTAVDIPDIKVDILECPSVDNLYGVKGVGEMTGNAPSPAIVNAIHDAIGVWFNKLPVTPEDVLKALEEKKSKK